VKKSCEVFCQIKLALVPECSINVWKIATANIAALLAVVAVGVSGATASTITAAVPASNLLATAGACEVTAGSLTWGFKESFRSYISGTIAKGKWTVGDGATYSTPNFGWTDASGSLDGAAGSIAFAGSIEFTGHGGILDTTVANPSVRFDGSTAYLDLDVAGTTQQGNPIDEKSVEFVVLDLTAATVEATGSTVEIVGAPAHLTADGAHAFGTYKSGEKFDPVTLSFTTSSTCASNFVQAEREAESAPERVAVTLTIATVVALVIGGVILLVTWRRRVARRRAAEPGE
jgi:Htaa